MTRRGLVANTSLALVGDAAAKGGMFLALLLLARVLPVAEFARLGVAMAAMLILTTALDGGVATFTTKEGAADPGARLTLLRAGAVARLPLFAVAAAGAAAAGIVLRQPALAAAVLVCAAANAAQQGLFASFRGGQNLMAEAVAKSASGLSYPVLCGAAALAGYRTALAAMIAMTIGPLATLPPLALLAHRVSHRAGAIRPLPLLRRSAPFGLIAVATLLYYRAPMLLMGGLSTHGETAAYSLAANLAFGLLMVPAAIAAGLLPRLSAERDPDVSAALVRRAVAWSTAILAAVGVLAAATAYVLLPPLFGSAYAGVFGPLAILLLSTLAIGAAGILGTALVALDRRREIVLQVLAALAVNLAAALLLIPVLAADGAALATLVTECASLAFLTHVYLRARGRHAPVPPRAVLAR